MKGCISKHYRKAINLLCVAAFSIQMDKVVTEWLFPTQTTVEISEKHLQEVDFPIVKICASSGFNVTALMQAGYASIFDYFAGQSKFNSSQYGWAGHSNGSFNRGSVKGNF